MFKQQQYFINSFFFHIYTRDSKRNEKKIGD